MEGNEPTKAPTPPAPVNAASKEAAAAVTEISGGVAFEAPAPSPEDIPEKDSVRSVSLEEVDRELARAGVTPDKTSEPPRGDEPSSALADKKARLAASPAPQVKPPPAPARGVGQLTPPHTDAQKESPEKTLEEIKRENVSDLTRPLRTYKDDIARAVKRRNLSVADVSVAEQERKLKRMQEERMQLELKATIEKNRARLEALKAAQRETIENRKQRVPTVGEEGGPTIGELQERTTPAPEIVRVGRDDTYERGELTEQAALLKREARPAPPPPPRVSGMPKAPAPAPLPPKVQVAKIPATATSAETLLKASEVELAERADRARESLPLSIPDTALLTNRTKILLTSLGLLVVGAAALGGVWYMSTERPPSLLPLQIDTLVFSEKTARLSVGERRGAAFLTYLTEEVEKLELPQNAVGALELTAPTLTLGSEALTTQQWFERAESEASPALVRALHPAFMFGVHAWSGTEPFLLLKTAFYENAFAGMLEWEQSMSSDLAPLFGPPVLGDMGAALTAPSPLRSPFRDRIIDNLDTRVLIDLSGEIRLIYGFVDRQTILIATNRDTFLEIVSRLRTTRTVR